MGTRGCQRPNRLQEIWIHLSVYTVVRRRWKTSSGCATCPLYGFPYQAVLRIRELSYDTQVGRCFFVRGDNSAQGRTGMESQFNGPLHVRAVLSTVSRDREHACNVEAGAHELDVSHVVQLALCALRGCHRGRKLPRGGNTGELAQLHAGAFGYFLC